MVQHSPIAVVLAAGKGTRMQSDLPKVLARAAGRTLIEHVLAALRAAGVPRTIVVIGYRGEDVQRQVQGCPGVDFAWQREQRGTGHAVMACRSQLHDVRGPVLVVAGDSPLLQPRSVRSLLSDFAAQPAGCVMGTLLHEHPFGLGRIVRDPAGEFLAIVEEKDASDEERQIREVNMSTYVFDCESLLAALDLLTTDNRQGEYYITDVPALMLRQGLRVRALPILDSCEALSVNTVEELQRVEHELLRREPTHA